MYRMRVISIVTKNMEIVDELFARILSKLQGSNCCMYHSIRIGVKRG